MSLFSADYKRLSAAEQWFTLATAYIDSSIKLFEAMREGSVHLDFPHAQVSAYLFIQSLELFLKAGIGISGNKVPGIHNNKQLYNQFKNLYPGKKYDFIGDIAGATIERPDCPESEFLRYPVDKSGAPWIPELDFVNFSTWCEQTRLFREDYHRLFPLLKARWTKPPNQN